MTNAKPAQFNVVPPMECAVEPAVAHLTPHRFRHTLSESEVSPDCIQIMESRVPSRVTTIVQICPCYVDFSRETGGVANIVRQISLGLARRGYEVILLCGNRELGRVQAPPGRHQVAPGLTQHVFCQGPHPLLGPTKDMVSALQSNRRPLMAHVHTCFSAFTEFAMFALARLDVPFLFTPHGKLAPEFLCQSRLRKMAWWRLVGRRAVRHARSAAVSNRREAASYSGMGLPHDFVVVPNGFSAEPFADPGRGAPEVRQPYLLFLGYLDPRKQPELLVHAFAASRCRDTHQLVIAGPDSYHHRATVEAAIVQHRLRDSVLLYGPAYGEAKWRLLRNAAGLCLPSLAEGMPVVLAEGLGAGLPLIVSRECNFPEAAIAGAAIELSTFNIHSWADAMDSVCLNTQRSQAMAAAAHKMAPGYTWDAVVDKWIAHYQTLLSLIKPTPYAL